MLIFLSASSEEELIERLRRRQTESEGQLRYRIRVAQDEMRRIGEFDYIVINHESELGKTVDQVLYIIAAEHCRVQQRDVKL